MDELLPHYERELALLRRATHEFAARFPKIAARMSVTDGEIDDPHLGRLLQSFALLGARISKRLGDDYPEFAEALIDTLFPEQLRVIPSCSIAQFDAAATAGQLTAPVTVPRGTELEDRAGTCRFRTSYDVTLAPILVDEVNVTPAAAAAPQVALPPNTSVLVSITFASLADGADFHAAVPDRLRLHLHGTPAMVAAMTDAFLLHAPKAFVQSDRSQRWKALAQIPLTAAGYATPEALVPGADDLANPPWRLLREYFAFPDKFAFIDLDMTALVRAAQPHRRLTLHLPIADMPDGTPARRQLDTLAIDHLRLGCTPVVNVFSRHATPIPLKPEATTYPVTPQVLNMRDVTARAIESVRLTNDVSPEATGGKPVPRYRGFTRGRGKQTAPVFWLAARREFTEGNDAWQNIMLVDLDGQPVSQVTGQLLVSLTCTNGNYPAMLPTGAADGDLCNEKENLPGRVALLRTPTPCRTGSMRQGALWRLITGLSPHILTLQSPNADALKELLRLLYPEAPGSLALVDAIVDVSHKSVMQWMSVPPMPTFIRGLEITVTFEAAALDTISLYACSRLLDPFFAHFAPANGYVQCVIRAAGPAPVMMRCPPRLGTRPIA
ncbi:type VI secretion system baseplate subunit TssF [Burkholderia ubonensis]|uniref:type VI secretion system baseplate subunit TssF n=1 Tax=Burkholderia ubonensis TaxID=101571 RepID=UPI00016A2971|nr:type VI secretion system baseplate subunit TssF [Burkholderia ubonensis]